MSFLVPMLVYLTKLCIDCMSQLLPPGQGFSMLQLKYSSVAAALAATADHNGASSKLSHVKLPEKNWLDFPAKACCGRTRTARTSNAMTARNAFSADPLQVSLL